MAATSEAIAVPPPASAGEATSARPGEKGSYGQILKSSVLVGGSSLLEGTQELAERIFGLPVRRGLPINLHGMPEELMKPAYTTAAGLLLHAAGANGAVSNGAVRGGRLGKLRSLVSDWMRDFF